MKKISKCRDEQKILQKRKFFNLGSVNLTQIRQCLGLEAQCTISWLHVLQPKSFNGTEDQIFRYQVHKE